MPFRYLMLSFRKAGQGQGLALPVSGSHPGTSPLWTSLWPHWRQGDQTFGTCASVTCSARQAPGTVGLSVSHTLALFTSPKAHRVGPWSQGRSSSLPKLTLVVGGKPEARTQDVCLPKAFRLHSPLLLFTPAKDSAMASLLSRPWGYFAQAAPERQWKNPAYGWRPRAP